MNDLHDYERLPRRAICSMCGDECDVIEGYDRDGEPPWEHIYMDECSSCCHWEVREHTAEELAA